MGKLELKDAREALRDCEAFKSRLISLKEIEDNQKVSFPLKLHIIGFPYPFTCQSREELRGIINELADLLGYALMEKKDGD